MKKSWTVGLMTALFSLAAAAQDEAGAQGAATEVVARAGDMLIAANGARIGAVYRVADDGSVQLIVDGKMVTVPAQTLSMVGGRLTTSLSKSDVHKLR